jgi:hypothetical protein
VASRVLFDKNTKLICFFVFCDFANEELLRDEIRFDFAILVVDLSNIRVVELSNIRDVGLSNCRTRVYCIFWFLFSLPFRDVHVLIEWSEKNDVTDYQIYLCSIKYNKAYGTKVSFSEFFVKQTFILFFDVKLECL